MISVILVAAGKGKRMNSATPKQFISIHGKNLLMYSLEKFLDLNEEIEIILVLNKDYFEYGHQIIAAYPETAIRLVEGGTERFHSVKNALNTITPNSELVLIHDGVRPFTNSQMIANCISTCREKGNAIPCVPLKDSIRLIHDNNNSEAVDRNIYRAIQTPQCFLTDIIVSSYAIPYHESYTDDASVVEANGIKIVLSEGDTSNVKITTPEDLLIANALLS